MCDFFLFLNFAFYHLAPVDFSIMVFILCDRITLEEIDSYFQPSLLFEFNLNAFKMRRTFCNVIQL